MDSYLKYVSYLKHYYFRWNARFSFNHWNYNREALDYGTYDCTNNVSETLNAKLNQNSNNGFQSYSTILSVIYHYKKNYYETVTLPNTVRKRDKRLIFKYQVIENYLYQYDDLEIEQKEEKLIPLLVALSDIPSYGPALPFHLI